MQFFCELVFSLQNYIIEFNPPNKCTWSCNVLARSRFKLSSAFISLKKCRIIKRYFLQYAAILVTTFSFIHIWGKSLINKQIKPHTLSIYNTRYAATTFPTTYLRFISIIKRPVKYCLLLSDHDYSKQPLETRLFQIVLRKVVTWHPHIYQQTTTNNNNKK